MNKKTIGIVGARGHVVTPLQRTVIGKGPEFQ